MPHKEPLSWLISIGTVAVLLLQHRFLVKELRKRSWLHDHGLRAPGTVTAEDFTRNVRNRERYVHVTFITSTGTTYSGPCPPGAASGSLPRGAAVTVVYDANNPRNFRVEQDLSPLKNTLLLLLNWVAIALIIFLQFVSPPGRGG